MDMTEYGYTMLGRVKLTVPAPQVDPRKKMVEALKTQCKQPQEEHVIKIKAIDEHLQELLALPPPTSEKSHE